MCFNSPFVLPPLCHWSKYKYIKSPLTDGSSLPGSQWVLQPTLCSAKTPHTVYRFYIFNTFIFISFFLNLLINLRSFFLYVFLDCNGYAQGRDHNRCYGGRTCGISAAAGISGKQCQEKTGLNVGDSSIQSDSCF